jgi:hypothetical protein
MERKRSRKKQEATQERKRIEVTVTVDDVLAFSHLLSDFVYEHKVSIPVAIGGMQFLQEFMIADMGIPPQEIDKMRHDIKNMTKEALDQYGSIERSKR